MSEGLLLIDIQNDYFAGGKMELVGMEQASRNARTLLDAFRAKGAPVFHIQHLAARPGATFFLPATEGAEIHPRVAPGPGETVIQKHFPNSFRATGLLDALSEHGVEAVVICGAMSHMCVDATTRAAFDHGLRCKVVDDACATRELGHRGERIAAHAVHAAFMAALAVPYAEILSTTQFVGENS